MNQPRRPKRSPELSRRAFLRQLTALSSLGAATPLGLGLSAVGEAAAQSAPGGYRALVGVFLYGGNDSYNTVLSTGADDWGHYLNHRQPTRRNPQDSSPSLALLPPGTPPDPAAPWASAERLGGVLAVQHRGGSAPPLAFHPLLPDLHALYQSGRLAVLANVGTLTEPISKADYLAGRGTRPAKLFSHNDQQSTWQSLAPEGAPAGWGGRLGDLLMARNGVGLGALTPLIQQSLTCLSPGEANVWLTGLNTRALQLGAADIPNLNQAAWALGHGPLQTTLASIMGGGASATANNLFAADHQALVRRALASEALINSVLPGLGGSQAPWSTAGVGSPWQDPKLFYDSPIDGSRQHNPLAMQLQMVARLMAANQLGRLGLTRQVFMVGLQGFDQHDHHRQDHADRMAQLNHALAYFDAVLADMPGGDMRNQVTTFTASEFGRTLTSNGDGTDHGWGAHHLVMGGAVQGGQTYGRWPRLATADAQGAFDSPDLIDNGALLPSTSVAQLAYTLGRWLGASRSELLGILPPLAAFDASSHDLGFMGA